MLNQTQVNHLINFIDVTLHDNMKTKGLPKPKSNTNMI